MNSGAVTGNSGADRPGDVQAVSRRLLRLADELATLPVLDPRTADDILDYDDWGAVAVSGVVADASAVVRS